MAFDAGTIMAHLDLDERAFNRKLDAAERREQEFSKRTSRSTVKLGVAPQEANQLRRQMDQLDRQLTQDAIRRSNSGQGSVLATLLGMSSPSAARAQATQQQQAQRSVLSRLAGSIGGGGGGGGGFLRVGGGGGGGNGNMGLGSGLFRGIGPGILGLGTRTSLIAGLGGTALGALPSLAGPLGALGIGGLGLGVASGIGRQALSGITPLLSAQQQAQQALSQATTKQQRQAAQQQLAGVQQALGQQPAALQTIFKSLSQIQSTWQKFTAGLAPQLVGPIHAAAHVFTSLLPDIRSVFGSAMTLVTPFIRGIGDLAHMVLPLLGQAFRAAAPLMRPLLDGIGKLVAGLLPGLTTLIRASAPAVRAFGSFLGTIGSGLGKMLADFAPAIRASSVVLIALGKVLGGLFPVIGQLASIMARTLAPIFTQLAKVIRALEPTLIIIGHVFAALAGAILGDLVAAFSALARLLILIQPAIRIFANALSQVFTVLENSGVFAVLGDALEKLVPIFARLVNQVVRALAPALPPLIRAAGTLAAVLAGALAAGLGDLLIAITPVLVLAARLTTALILWLSHTHLLVPALGLLTAAWLLFSSSFSITPIGAMITVIGLLVIAVVELVKHWHTVWSGIKAVAADAWHFIWDGFGKFLLPLLGPAGLIALGAIELAKHWSQITGAIKSDASSLWQHLVGWGDDIRQLFTHTIPGYWDSFWNATQNRLIHPLEHGFDALRSFIHDHLVAPLDNFFTQTIPNALRDFVTTAGNVMQRIQGAMEAPVKWVVDHVLNGLISAFDWISGKVGGPHINAVHPMGLAAGGKITGGTTETADDVLIRVSKNETVLSGQHSRLLAPLLSMIGVPGYAGGGRVGQNPPHRHGNPHLPQGQADPGGGIGSWFHKAADIGKILAAVVSGNTTALTNAIKDLIPGGVGGAVADMSSLLVDIPRTLIKDVVSTLIGLGGGLGGNGSAIVKDALSWLGKIPYVWGGTAVPGGADCSGFVQTIYRRHGIIAPRTSEAQGSWVRRTPPTIGGLAFYHSPPGGADPGHVAIYAGRNRVISQGGGMGPQLETLRFLPLLWTGVPPGGGSAVGLSGPLQAMAQQLLGRHGWANQWPAFNSLETREAGWNIHARNPNSGAYGLAQFINGPREYYQYGGNPFTGAGQLTAMMNYIAGRYPRGPNEAWSHELSAGWYDFGGWLKHGQIGLNTTGRPEAVLNPAQSSAMLSLAEALRLSQANSGPGYSTGIEARLERVIRAIERSSAATGAAVGDALNGTSRTSFYRSNYSARGV